MIDMRVTSAWAVCDDCLLSVAVTVHPDNERGSLDPEEDWDTGLRCPICGDRLTTEEIVHPDAGGARMIDHTVAVRVIKINGTYLVWDCIKRVYRSEDGSEFTPKQIAERAENVEVIA